MNSDIFINFPLFPAKFAIDTMPVITVTAHKAINQYQSFNTYPHIIA